MVRAPRPLPETRLPVPTRVATLAGRCTCPLHAGRETTTATSSVPIFAVQADALCNRKDLVKAGAASKAPHGAQISVGWASTSHPFGHPCCHSVPARRRCGPTTLIETNKKKMRYRYKNQTGLQAQLLGRGASGGRRGRPCRPGPIEIRRGVPGPTLLSPKPGRPGYCRGGTKGIE